MRKNTSGQDVLLFTFNRLTNEPVTGDAANITAKIAKDGGALAATTTANPTELESGYYRLPLSQAETDADAIDVVAVSASADVQVIPLPAARIYTTPANFQQLSIDGSGGVSIGATGLDGTSTPADWITAATIAADAGFEIATAVDTTLSASHGAGSWEPGASGDATQAKQDQIIAALSSKPTIHTNPPSSTRLVLIRGDSYDDVGNPRLRWDFGKDLSGYAVTFTVRDKSDDSVVLTAAGSASGNAAVVLLSSADTAALPLGIHKYDVEVDKAGSKQSAIGEVVVLEDQTR